MKTTKTMIAISCTLLGLISAVSAWANDPLPVVAGVSSMTPVTDSSCFAVWVPVPTDYALAGLMWYNNDELTVFPEIRLESGTPDNPVSFSESHPVAESVIGESSAWSSVTFTEPVTCASTGLYVLIRLPEGSEQEALGIGGGAGIGFVEDGGCTGWMSIDGVRWVKVGRNYGFAVQPHFVKAQGGMMQMLGSNIPQDLIVIDETEGFDTELLPASPNPFNPVTEIRFTLKESDHVKITIFDLRGRKVAGLADGVFSQGEQRLTWEGRNSAGHRVSSGVYFVHMQVGNENFTRRMLLVK